MPLRNPFRKTPGGLDTDESSRDTAAREEHNGAGDGTKVLDIKEPTEYKLSEINDSGVYLPPSPPESKRSFWQSRSNTSTTSSNHRSVLNEHEPFNMSRESFDSYRRSFDISARSPVPSEYSVPTRQSLDSRRALHPTRGPSSRQERRSLDRVDAPPEEGFEDVKLNEDGKPKKKGFLGFGGQATPKSLADIEKPSSIGHHFFTGRKRGQSGGGAELSAMDRPNSRSSQVRTAVQSPGSGSGSVSGSGAAVTPAAAGTAPPAAPTATPTTPSAAAPTTSAPPAPPPIAQTDKQASAPAE